MKDIALTSFRNFGRNQTPNNLTNEEFQALKKLAANKDIIIQKSDKGNSVVIIDKSVYVEKMNEILSDRTKFLPCTKSQNNELKYIEDMEKTIRRVLKKLQDDRKLSTTVYNKIYPIGSRPGKLYGLAKTHKPAVDKKPYTILSAIGTSTYHLSKFLVPLLATITTNNFSTKDSFHFAQEILHQDSSLYMASLDIESLFTNIPLNETINIAVDQLFANNETVAKFTKDEFRELLELATKQSWFIFDGTYYQQIDGVAMGNPLGPTLANIFMCHFESQWVEQLPPNIKPSFYRRYVDDIFVLLKDHDQLTEFKEYLNNCHPNINFTDEEEKEGNLSFLDIKLFRENGRFSTTVHRKPSFTGLYTNFASLIPTVYKKGLILGLLSRLYKICSNWSIFDFEVEKLTSILSLNGYPTFFIDKCIYLFVNNLHTSSRPNEENKDQPVLQITLPYLGELSKTTRKRIESAIRQNIPSCKIRITFTTLRRIANFFNFKDIINKGLQSHVVYKLQCDDCNIIYYGFAARHLQIRAYDHLGLSYLTGKPIKGVKTSMKEHCTTENHHITWDNVSIIARDENQFHLHIKESLLIKRDQPELNKQLYSTPLALF